MKKLLPLILLFSSAITACDGWVYVVPTFPAPPPSPTPSVFAATPLFITATDSPNDTPEVITNTPDRSGTPVTKTATVTPTETATIVADTVTPSLSANSSAIDVEIVGCNTSIDITHGMGEVTNAYVILKNTSGQDLADLCVTLLALDEGRVHPDKTVCVLILANNYQVSLKLTVDSTYKQETPIQVEVKRNDILLARVDRSSCTEIDLSNAPPSTLLTPVPIP